MSASNPGPMFMMLVAVVFSFLIAWIAHRGINGSTGVSIAINVVQITALLVFAVMALAIVRTIRRGLRGGSSIRLRATRTRMNSPPRSRRTIKA